MNKALVTAIVDRTADPASIAWAHEGTGALANLPDALAAIEAAGQIGNVVVLQTVNAPKDLKKAAALALHKARSRGLKIVAPANPVAFSLGREVIEVPSRAFLSLPDMEGEQELTITCTDTEGTCALGIIVSATGELREARHAHLNRAGLRDFWKQAEGRRDLAEVPFTAALAVALGVPGLVRDHAWMHFLEHVPAETLAQARALDLATAAAGLPGHETDGGASAEGWLPPASLFGGDMLAATFRAITEKMTSGEEEGTDADTELAAALDAAFTDEVRERFVAAARRAALAWRWHGRPEGAARLETLADNAASGPGSSFPALVTAFRLAVGREAMSAFQQMGADDAE